jgi:hypothetical protein
MSQNKEVVLCTCPKCKKNGIGKYVHPTTKWRHDVKSAKRKYSKIESNRLVILKVNLFNK